VRLRLALQVNRRYLSYFKPNTRLWGVFIDFQTSTFRVPCQLGHQATRSASVLIAFGGRIRVFIVEVLHGLSLGRQGVPVYMLVYEDVFFASSCHVMQDKGRVLKDSKRIEEDSVVGMRGNCLHSAREPVSSPEF
jgi:hypothetical protein